MIEPTNDNLRSRIATKPLARWLISAAHEETKLTYGNVQNRLETQCHFGNIGRPTRTGVVAGAMQDEILNFNPKAPLLNVLLVRQDTERLGAGVREYLARRFPEGNLEDWNNIYDQAASAVYDYPYWNDLYGDIYGNDYVIDLNDEPDPVGAEGVEKDGLHRGRGGEGENHKTLRLWVRNNPHLVVEELDDVRAETEVEILSGDRVDVVYYTERKIVVIEVKSEDSIWHDLR